VKNICKVTPERWVQQLSNFLLCDSSTCEQPTADEMQPANPSFTTVYSDWSGSQDTWIGNVYWAHTDRYKYG